MSTPEQKAAAIQENTHQDIPNIRVNLNWCKGCGICIAMCPMDVYKADKNGKPTIAQLDLCIWCERCEIYCPDFAINLGGWKNW